VAIVEESPDYNNDRSQQREKTAEGIKLVFRNRCPTEIYVS
jgi:hypothetical protein